MSGNRFCDFKYGQHKGIHMKEVSLSGRFRRVVHIVAVEMYRLNPFAPEPPVTARTDPGPFYPL